MPQKIEKQVSYLIFNLYNSPSTAIKMFHKFSDPSAHFPVEYSLAHVGKVVITEVLSRK